MNGNVEEQMNYYMHHKMCFKELFGIFILIKLNGWREHIFLEAEVFEHSCYQSSCGFEIELGKSFLFSSTKWKLYFEI